eukprot:2576063-Rhodomonas_salina.1
MCIRDSGGPTPFSAPAPSFEAAPAPFFEVAPPFGVAPCGPDGRLRVDAPAADLGPDTPDEAPPTRTRPGQ